MSSRSFRLDLGETREQWVVTRTPPHRRQQAGFRRHPVRRFFAEHRRNPGRGVEACPNQCGTVGEPVPISIAGDRNIDPQPLDCQTACEPKPLEVTMGRSPKVVLEYLEDAIWTEWRRAMGDADGA